jgi:predicted transcriptional regulator of viral defense system
MPCLRVTSEQARALFGLTTPAVQWVLERLTNEGFLSRTANGDYFRKNAEP